MNEEINRIQRYLELKKISQRQFGLSIGKSHAYLNNAIKQGSSPSIDILSKIVDVYPDLNIEYIITGKGNMVKETHLLKEPGGLHYQKELSIDEIVDKKIEDKFAEIRATLAEFVIKEIDKEIEETKTKMANIKKLKKD